MSRLTRKPTLNSQVQNWQETLPHCNADQNPIPTALAYLVVAESIPRTYKIRQVKKSQIIPRGQCGEERETLSQPTS